MIGRALATYLAEAGECVLSTTRRRETVSEQRVFLDLAEDLSTWRPPAGIRVAYLCAAVTSLAQCRDEPTQSAQANVRGTVAVAEALLDSGAFVVFLSSNLVYDGSVPLRKAEDPLCPQTEYGRQKAETERQLLARGEAVAVVRLTKILSAGTPLLAGWIRALQEGEPIHPFSDRVLAPVPLSFAVQVLCRVGESRLPGVLQMSAEQDITYEQLGQHLSQRMGASPDLVQPVRSADSGLVREESPRHTSLDTSRLRGELGLDPPLVWDTVDSVVRSSLAC